METGDHELRNDRNQGQIDCSCKGDASQNGLDILGGSAPGPDSRNESSVLSHIAGDFRGIEYDGGIKVAKENNKGDKEEIV